MAQLSKKIELYCSANGVNSVDFMKDVILHSEAGGDPYIYKWNIDGLAKPTDDQIASYETAGNTAETLNGVLNKRAREYPSIPDQLDKIYHEGIDEWKKVIKAVKDANPKG